MCLATITKTTNQRFDERPNKEPKVGYKVFLGRALAYCTDVRCFTDISESSSAHPVALEGHVSPPHCHMPLKLDEWHKSITERNLPADNHMEYPQGFHVFVNLEDAITYLSLLNTFWMIPSDNDRHIREVDYAGILAEGTQTLYSGERQAPCVVVRWIKIGKRVNKQETQYA